MPSALYAGYPTAFAHAEPNPQSKKIGHLLWGTWVENLEEEKGDWLKVRLRGWDVNRQPKIGWMKKNSVQSEKTLEIYFVDIGQGDGCLIITPDDKFHLIDAGEGRNMAAFLRWKFNLKRSKGITFENTIITHSDSDHYKGFLEILKEPNIKFKNVYHNGLIEREGEDLLGPRDGNAMTGIVEDHTGLDEIINDPASVGRKNYPKLMQQFRQKGADIKMLCSEDKFLPGYEDPGKLKINVLGPVPGKDSGGSRTLAWFGDNGKTKNGHSVVLKLEYGLARVLLGGDLNIPAENHLLKHYTQKDPSKIKSEASREDLIKKARKIFEVDVAKACHHGSADFTSVFLQSVNPAATVISSGDNEPHVHPRPDAVGAFGKFGRGDRPLIFSTELARSAKELFIKAAGPTKEQVGRTVAVYGMINLRTDGEKIILAQKMEQKATRGEWDVYELKPDANGVMSYFSKHEE
jgi:beta-lactamase superfamily II metal-dependent hydrolase